MKYYPVRFLLLLTFLLPFGMTLRLSAAETGDFRIECRMDSSVYFEREDFPIVVTLVTTEPEIAYANVVEPLRLKKGEFSSIKQISPPGNPYREIRNNDEFFCYPLEAYMVAVSESGRYELEGGEFVIGIPYKVIVNDPMWGPVATVDVKEIRVVAEKKRFTIESLPPVPPDCNYSGSIGDFTIETFVPRGDIFVGEEASAFIIVKGNGTLADSTLPEYRSAFKNGLKLKSVSESRHDAFDGGKKISELQLECVFIPQERDGLEIGSVSFDFFDPASGHYRTVYSKPVRIDTKSSTAKREKLNI